MRTCSSFINQPSSLCQIRALARQKAGPSEFTEACYRSRDAFSAASATGKANEYLGAFLGFINQVGFGQQLSIRHVGHIPYAPPSSANPPLSLAAELDGSPSASFGEGNTCVTQVN